MHPDVHSQALLTLQAVLTQAVRPLDGATSRALAQVIHILQCLSSHLPVPLSRVGRLVFGYGLQNSSPDILQQSGNADAETWNCDCERVEEAWSSLAARKE